MIRCSCGKWTPGMGVLCSRCHIGLRGSIRPMDDGERIALQFVADEERRMEMAFAQEQLTAAQRKRVDGLGLVEPDIRLGYGTFYP